MDKLPSERIYEIASKEVGRYVWINNRGLEFPSKELFLALLRYLDEEAQKSKESK